MGIIDRTVVSASMIGGGAIGGTFWLYLKAHAEPLVNDHAGLWSSQWQLFQWVIPLACTLMVVLGGLYLVYGGAQEERAATRKRRRVR